MDGRVEAMSDILDPNIGTTLVTTVRKVTRQPSSANGNPRWTLHTDHGAFVTKPDAMCAFGVSSNWSAQRVAITFDGRARVIGVEDLTGRWGNA